MAETESHGGGEGSLPATAGSGSDALRASHADRDKIVDVLRAAAGDGRLSPEELDERLERALTAKTYAELAILTTDLPVAGTAPVPVSAGVVAGAGPAGATPKDLIKIEVGSGSARREGRWVVPRELDVKIASGGVRLDFTQAVITQPILRITAEVRSGVLRLITKPGIVVQADDVSVRSGIVKLPEPPDPGTPLLLRVEVSGTARSGSIVAHPPRPPRLPRPPRRTFWQWLRRAPRPGAITP